MACNPAYPLLGRTATTYSSERESKLTATPAVVVFLTLALPAVALVVPGDRVGLPVGHTDRAGRDGALGGALPRESQQRPSRDRRDRYERQGLNCGTLGACIG